MNTLVIYTIFCFVSIGIIIWAWNALYFAVVDYNEVKQEMFNYKVECLEFIAGDVTPSKARLDEVASLVTSYEILSVLDDLERRIKREPHSTAFVHYSCWADLRDLATTRKEDKDNNKYRYK